MSILKKNIAIILASGLGKRFGIKEPKQYLRFNNQLLLNHTIQLFLNHRKIDLILVMVNKNHRHHRDKHAGGICFAFKSIHLSKVPKIFFFREKRSSIACLVGSGLKDIFHWKAHDSIVFKS